MSSMSDEVMETGKSQSPGPRLQEAREKLGLSQKSVADDLYLPRNYIMWIEEGTYEKLPSMVFCRGYIRAYAKIVGENGEELIAILDGIYGNQNIKAPLMSVSKIDEQVKVGDPVMKWSSLLFVIVLCGVVFWWWKTQYGLSTSFFTSQDPIAVETANGNELVLPSLDGNQVIETSNAQLSTGTTSETSLAGTQLNAVASSNSNVVNNGTGIELSLNIIDDQAESQPFVELEKVVSSTEEAEQSLAKQTLQATQASNAVLNDVSVDIKLLQIQFSNECWITIKDVRGKILFNGIKKSGQRLSLSGDAPLSVSIGRVDSVSKLVYGGTTVDLSPMTRNNIANFKLPL